MSNTNTNTNATKETNYIKSIVKGNQKFDSTKKDSIYYSTETLLQKLKACQK